MGTDRPLLAAHSSILLNMIMMMMMMMSMRAGSAAGNREGRLLQRNKCRPNDNDECVFNRHKERFKEFLKTLGLWLLSAEIFILISP